jgi:PPOX class probable F420-dependent enzyme
MAATAPTEDTPMPPAPVPPEIDAFLSRPNHGVVATLRPDGTPHTAVTWYDWEDGRVLLNMEDTRIRLRWLHPGAPLALSAIDPDEFYRHVSLLGRVAEVGRDPDLANIDRLSVRYTGAPYANREARRASAWMEVDSWHGFVPDGYTVLGPQGRPGSWAG